MARTKASVGAKVSAGKSSKARCSVAPPTSSSSSTGGEKSSRGYSGGNPVCPRETPKWQKPITNFFITNQNNNSDDVAAGSSKSKPKRNIIHSDDESDSEERNKKQNEIKENGNESDDNQNANESKENKSNENESDTNKSGENDAESQEYECSQSYDSPPKNRELDESIILEPLTGENSHKLEEYYTKDKGKGKGKKSKEDNNNRISFKRQSEDIETPNAKKIKVN